MREQGKVRAGGGGRGGGKVRSGRVTGNRAVFVHKIVPKTLRRLLHCTARVVVRTGGCGRGVWWPGGLLRDVSRVLLELDRRSVTPLKLVQSHLV